MQSKKAHVSKLPPCFQCGTSFKTTTHAQSHVTRFPDGSCKIDATSFLCPVCRRKFDRKLSLEQHLCSSVQVERQPPPRVAEKRKKSAQEKDCPPPQIAEAKRTKPCEDDWRMEEETALEIGVKEFGLNWSLILSKYGFALSPDHQQICILEKKWGEFVRKQKTESVSIGTRMEMTQEPNCYTLTDLDTSERKVFDAPKENHDLGLTSAKTAPPLLDNHNLDSILFSQTPFRLVCPDCLMLVESGSHECAPKDFPDLADFSRLSTANRDETTRIRLEEIAQRDAAHIEKDDVGISFIDTKRHVGSDSENDSDASELMEDEEDDEDLEEEDEYDEEEEEASASLENPEKVGSPATLVSSHFLTSQTTQSVLFYSTSSALSSEPASQTTPAASYMSEETSPTAASSLVRLMIVPTSHSHQIDPPASSTLPEELENLMTTPEFVCLQSLPSEEVIQPQSRGYSMLLTILTEFAKILATVYPGRRDDPTASQFVERVCLPWIRSYFPHFVTDTEAKIALDVAEKPVALLPAIQNKVKNLFLLYLSEPNTAVSLCEEVYPHDEETLSDDVTNYSFVDTYAFEVVLPNESIPNS